MASIPVRLTVYQSPRAVASGVPWEGTIDELLSDLDVGPKEQLPYLAPHTLKEGGARRGECIERVSQFLWLDLDGTWGPPVALALDRLGAAWWAWPSPSGREGRARVGVLASRETTLDEARTVLQWIDAQLGGVCDRHALHPVQGFFHGIEEGVQWWVESREGSLLDVESVLRSTPTRVSCRRPARAPTSDDLSAWSDAWRAEQARELVESIPAASEGSRHASLFRVAQLCRDWAVGIDRTREIVLEWNERHCDPPKGADVIESAIMRDIDRYRWHPVGYVLPRIVRVGHGQRSEILSNVATILGESGVYVRDGVLCEISDGAAIDCTEVRVTTLVHDHVYAMKVDRGTADRTLKDGTVKPGRKSEWRRCDPPEWIAEALLARPNHPELPPLRAITPLPSLTRSGLMSGPSSGYDPVTGLYVVEGLPDRVPVSPSLDSVYEALDRVLAVYDQFPLSEIGVSVVFSYLLCAVGREYIDGPVPALILDANRPQCGKSKLAKMICTLTTGSLDSPKSTSWCTEEGKMLAELHAAIGSEPRALFFENVPNGSYVSSAVLDSSITSRSIGTRRLFTQVESKHRFDALVLICGNGVQVGGDLAWRSLYERLESPLEDPTERDDLRIASFDAWIWQHRAALTLDLLTIWRGWIAAGSPVHGASSWATFAAWDNTARSVCVWLGLPDPTDARSTRTAEDADSALLEGLLGWIEKMCEKSQSAKVTVSGLLDSLRPPRGFSISSGENEQEKDERLRILGDIAQSAKKPPRDLSAADIGILLRRLRNRVQNGKCLKKSKTRGVLHWRCVYVEST